MVVRDHRPLALRDVFGDYSALVSLPSMKVNLGPSYIDLFTAQVHEVFRLSHDGDHCVNGLPQLDFLRLS